jgi:hypothetical protein
VDRIRADFGHQIVARTFSVMGTYSKNGEICILYKPRSLLNHGTNVDY